VASLQAQITFVLVVSVAAFAQIWGGRRERVGAVTILASLLSGYVLMNQWHGLGLWPFILVDVICLGMFISLCWKSPHPWPYWASGAQGLNLMCELVGPQHLSRPLATALLVSGYGVVLSLLIGTISAIRRRHNAAKRQTQEIG